ncbi:MAG TPA: L-threonylcarbamoyladenylate synthase [Syntrophales bacterium]|nr:L-threonylcarbamoyladenylate synthase [Syntrophales bacterium]
MPEVLKIDPKNPNTHLLTEAVRIIKDGGVIAYPTETFYGLGADGRSEKAIERIFLIKGRNIKEPLSVIIGDRSDLRDIVGEIPESALRLMESFWPGALTLVFTASQNVSSLLTAGTGKIGVRISSHPVAAALARAFRHPITATSANLSGATECTSAQEVLKCIGDKIDAVIDGGRTPGGKGSTIIDVAVRPSVILREGVISGPLILHVLADRQ